MHITCAGTPVNGIWSFNNDSKTENTLKRSFDEKLFFYFREYGQVYV